MPNCPIGSVDYKGYCVPSYFTDAQKEAYYREQEKHKEDGKESNKKFIVIFAGIGVVALGFILFNILL